MPPGPVRLAGGLDGGAIRHHDTVQRVAGLWTPSVHQLLRHLEARGFTQAPRAIEIGSSGRDVVSYLPGRTVGALKPWPPWVHSDSALDEVASWLRRYHLALRDFVPSAHAVWREQAAAWQPGWVVAHNDAAPYNAVWDADGLVGFVDWDMAGPRTCASDVAWVAFSWVPLHARATVAAEGFIDFGRRRARLARFLDGYGSTTSVDEVLGLVHERVTEQLRILRTNAVGGDATYVRMLSAGCEDRLRAALADLEMV